jgi:hypothetical protein
LDNRLWRVLAVVFGLLFVVALGLVILFGVRLAQNNQIKDDEAKSKLAALEEQLKTEFQKTQEQEDAEYVADEVFGAFGFVYPKVWFTNFSKDEGAQEELTMLADPNLIMIDDKAKNTTVALRVVLYKEKYDAKLAQVEGENKDNSLLVETDAKVSDISGKKFVGKDEATGDNVAFILVPLRDKTLYIGTDNYEQYKDQYEKVVTSFNLNK